MPETDFTSSNGVVLLPSIEMQMMLIKKGSQIYINVVAACHNDIAGIELRSIIIHNTCRATSYIYCEQSYLPKAEYALALVT